MAISRIGSMIGDLFNPGNPANTPAFNAGSSANRVLLVFAFSGFNFPSSHAATYAGVSMTELNNSPDVGGDRYAGGWYLFGPASGSNTLSVDFNNTSSQAIQWAAVAYDGVDQGGLDSQAENHSVSASSTFTWTTTTIAANAVCVCGGRCHVNAPASDTGATNLTTNNSGPAGAFVAESSTFPIVSPGSYSMTLNSNGAGSIEWAGFIVSLKPAGGAAAIPNKEMIINQAVNRASTY